MLEVIFWFGIASLYYAYDGYPRLLRLVCRIRGLRYPDQERSGDSGSVLPVTVLVTVHNEENVIGSKIDNILASNNLGDALELIVASDGSTDLTDQIVRGHPDPRVRLFRPDSRVGKTATQNLSVREARGEIIVFTDAETRFEPECIGALLAPFDDPSVGCSTGAIRFVSTNGDSVSAGQNRYWATELCIRERESKLGILAVATGACMAVRNGLFIPMDDGIGEDCIIPLDVVSQGKKVVHVSNAIAYDRMPDSEEGELKTRIRMTLRNWQGTWARKSLLNPLNSPGYAWALWSHKVLRWLSPFALISATVAVSVLAMGSYVYALLFVCMVMLYLLGMLGRVLNHTTHSWPVAGTAYSFLLANTGFFIGVLKALSSSRVTRY